MTVGRRSTTLFSMVVPSSGALVFSAMSGDVTSTVSDVEPGFRVMLSVACTVTSTFTSFCTVVPKPGAVTVTV